MLRCILSWSLPYKNVRYFSSKPSTSFDSNVTSVEPAQDKPEIPPAPTNEDIKLDKEMLMKLERLSGLRFRNLEEIENLQADIRLANKLFEVNFSALDRKIGM
jgi:hypothetical protein